MRNYSIDTVKCFAAFAVVSIHTQPFKEYNDLYFILRTLYGFAVPFFFLTTGYLFAKGTKVNNDIKYLKKYCRRILRILVKCIIVYIFYNLVKFLMSSSPKENTVKFIRSIMNFKNIYYGINEGGMFHLWYLFAILYIIPTIFIFRNKINLLLAFSMILNIIGIGIQVFNLDINVRDPLFYGLFYTTLGYFMFLNEQKILKSVENAKLSSLILLFIILQIIQILENYIYGGVTYLISTIVIQILLFIILMKHTNIGEKHWISKIGNRSMGIYLIHPMIIDIIYLIIYKLDINTISTTLIWQIVITPIVFILSIFIYSRITKVLYKKKSLSEI